MKEKDEASQTLEHIIDVCFHEEFIYDIIPLDRYYMFSNYSLLLLPFLTSFNGQ
jgi:hypothetical protein